ncbi:uncharacterized protein LOC132556625 [Ylistrum balloti]|uniref:uncharacterized protein LOC132556625 n=1 Tax=Ylistrum balloti TaxID=509963 RepID=UPI002905F2AE|nr:uncharacterized protein LOC132556625 [Ylistrum balloti]
MVLRCAWGTCTADERYPQRLNGARLILFPKPKTNLEKCLRWIKTCGRPHDQLNVNRINKHKAVCSTHFEGGNGPTALFPDPLPADGSKSTPARPLPKRRLLTFDTESSDNKKRKKFPLNENTEITNCEFEADDNSEGTVLSTTESATQTDERWISPLDLLSVTTELHELRAVVKSQEKTIEELQQLNKKTKVQGFGVKQVLEKEDNLKNVFKYYTGIVHIRFLALLSFLVPPGYKIPYEKGRRDIKRLSDADALFLSLCRLRHNFGLKDIAMRFGLSVQSAGVVFNTWIAHMYFKLGQLSIWPHRDTIIQNRPKEFRKDYSTTLMIIDGTELRTQTPSALGRQSQMYSDYKSCNTLKGLIGCDPNGNVMFVSEFHSGAISDKAIAEESGFYEVLKDMKKHGYMEDDDSIMADKGFTIDDELKKLGLRLNIPPFAKTGTQMSPAEISETQKIAKHRVHIERLVAKVKKFKMVSHRVPTSLFPKINEIWSVCCLLTLFQDVFVKDKQ